MTRQEEPPTVVLPTSLEARTLAPALESLLPSALRSYLPERRWFADKNRQIAQITVADVASRPVGGGWIVLTVCRIEFDAGEASDYLIPLALTRSPEALGVIARIRTGEDEWSVADATQSTAFAGWLLDCLSARESIAASHGRFEWIAEPALADYEAAAQLGPIRIGSAEQSNSAFIFGGAIFVKLFRRLRPGENPDEEVSRFLSRQSHFRQVPTLLGAGRYVSPTEESHATMLAQVFVPSVGDGWTWVLDQLRQIDADPEVQPALRDALTQLGRRTGELHTALGSRPSLASFAPEPVSEDDASAWLEATTTSAGQVIADLTARLHRLPSDAQAPARRLIAAHDRLGARLTGYRRLVGTSRIRVHGDYHLGQTMRTLTGDWVVLDFEGEPARQLAERRAKTSPLKDVAGMLRSFGYARESTARTGTGDPATLEAWEEGARSAFLSGYRAGADERARLLPPTEADFAAALTAWEIDKAVYEVRYEMSNRPNWLSLPLSALLRLVEEPAPIRQS